MLTVTILSLVTPGICHKSNNMNPLIYVAAAVVVLIVIIIVSRIISRSSNKEAAVPRQRVLPAQRNEAVPPAARRRRNVRGRLHDGRQEDASDEDGFDLDGAEQEDDDYLAYAGATDGKIGAKKRAKLEAKADRAKQREAELEDREEKKRQQEVQEEKRKRGEARRKLEEEEAEEQARIEREEQEKKEHEDYLAMKECFTVDTEGFDEQAPDLESQSLLEEFVNYIRRMKVVQLEDLAAEFRLKSQEAIDRVQALLDSGDLTGVIDDRGKFIYISEEELQAVAKFIHQRGRVSIAELAKSSNKLINLVPEIDSMQASS
ncbi:PREDICTED: DDRGK domain-containing protein 1-like [Priapulus caudatus]|uniref:DDRGK domain-containing protein 1 n=1 Tax=Priapulus caudatus TaxID=37621 RepID=A0ABM1DP18_PRICU|nr:PREDICTED: DDRGK domain-containing protein 1-like [Priapulus caudatus]